MAASKRRKPAKRGAQPRRKSRSRGSAPAWFYMLLGFVPGLVIAWMVHNYHVGEDPEQLADSEPVTQADDVATSRDDDDRPRFEFYKLLSESEVVVPDEPVELRRRPDEEEETSLGLEEQPVPEPPTAETDDDPPSEERETAEAQPEAEDVIQYLIQAGSFRNQEDADRLRARMALMGVEAEIQSVQIEGGETWHRVRVGPITDRDRADRVRARLEEENVSSILLRTRG
ncbi:SPOR domain-containing protein [Methylonatrum kenyense]|uniref:SPOR domain-containing protein n=1 Tax=Methylonatrum kenyense TaxID=455253 RepID=UPI0020BE85AF|nr:SPOR domain-containing protein [Methylonatrum kenyense]MCK8515184.1 SPOR domain-containing protein [Methylonatrum kenyense]